MIIFKRKLQFGTGCIPDESDDRDLKYEETLSGDETLTDEEWQKGFDIEKEIGVKIPIKNQGKSSSCVGNGWAYYNAILNTIEEKLYKEVSAKSIYSQIFQPGGGASIRDGAKLIVDWGALQESYLTSYNNSQLPTEDFMRELSWKNQKADDMAKILKAKEYRVIAGQPTIDKCAKAIKDGMGMVFGLYGENNGTWGSNEPRPPKTKVWAHCIIGGKYGIDRLGKYIATPNSWGERSKDELHPDGWQKLREDYFSDSFIFNPWVLIDRPNILMSDVAQNIVNKYEKKIIGESEGVGRKGIIINGKLREIKNDRVGDACLYALATNGFGTFVNTKTFDEITKDIDF